jgi:5'-3' exonuclease
MDSNTAQNVLVIDGGYATHRAFHALSSSNLSRPDGTPIWAIHGFFTSLAKLIAMRKPTHLLVALDAPGGCPARKTLLPEYKSNRTSPKPEFVSQALELNLLLAEAGVPHLSVPGWEADDIIASAATSASSRGMRCEIFSADRDLYQVLSNEVSMVRIDGTTVVPKDIEAKYSIPAGSYMELAAMRGEAADCIAGVPRVGEKTAAKILSAFGSFEKAVEPGSTLETVVSAKVAAILRENADLVRRNIEVATLRRDIEIDFSVCSLPLEGERLAASLRRAGLMAASSAMRNACA